MKYLPISRGVYVAVESIECYDIADNMMRLFGASRREYIVEAAFHGDWRRALGIDGSPGATVPHRDVLAMPEPREAEEWDDLMCGAEIPAWDSEGCRVTCQCELDHNGDHLYPTTDVDIVIRWRNDKRSKS